MDKVIKLALEEFKQATEAEAENRRNGLEALKFRNGDQWPTNVANSRALEARPCLTINRTPQFVRQITNDARQNRPQVKIAAVEDNDVETAEIYEGLIRHIQVASNADVAYDTAVEYQATMGFGFIRIITEYEDDESFDQCIRIKRVKNPFMVYLDPFAVEPDASDARFGFVVTDMTLEEFKREYPKAEATSGLVMSSTGDAVAGWITQQTVRVAEYFKVEEKPYKLVLLADGMKMRKDEYDALAEQGMMLPEIVNERDATERKVMWRKITACEVLEEREWPGKYIPIVPVYGEDLDIDGKRVLSGMVKNLMDPQRMYNYWSSAQTEAIALAPKAPFIIAEGQVEGYEQQWANANRDAKPYLTYKPDTIEGTIVPMPQRLQAEPPVQAMVQAIAQASEDMKATTGIYDASLGARSNETSGKAIQARRQQTDMANFHYIDNLSRAIRHIGVILVDLIPKIYDAPRVIRILGEDGESKVVRINELFDDGSGQQKKIDLSVGKYDVTVAVGPSYQTKRQETAEMMTQLVQAYPDFMQIAGDILVKNMDWPQADEVAKRFKSKMGIGDDEDGKQKIPPAVVAEMQKAQQMIDALTQQLNALQDEREAKQQDIESKERIAAMNNETKLAIATLQHEMNANLQILMDELKGIREERNMMREQEYIDTTSGVTQDNTDYGGEPLALNAQ